ncbi:MAG: PqqD family protein, partial [Alphaproteobacteria bacterium]
VLVYDVESNKAHCLNETAALIWKSCDGKTSISRIARFVEKQAGKSVSDDLVWLAIDQLNENNLLQNKLSSSFAGQSRREVIKKIGLASMVAIPVVASLVAPQSAMANLSCTCIVSNDCMTMTGCTDTMCCNEAFLCAPALPADPPMGILGICLS